MPLPVRGFQFTPPPPTIPRMPLGFRTPSPTGGGVPSASPRPPFIGIPSGAGGTRGIVRPTGFGGGDISQPPDLPPPPPVVPPPPTIYDDPTKPPPVPAKEGYHWFWDAENWMWIEVEDIPPPPNPFKEAGPRPPAPPAPPGFEYVWDPVAKDWVLQPVSQPGEEPEKPKTPPPPPAGSITQEEYAALLAVRPDPKPTTPPRAGFDWVLTTHTWTVLVRVPARDDNGAIIPDEYDYMPQNYYTYTWDEVDVGETEEERLRREEEQRQKDEQEQWEREQAQERFEWQQEQDRIKWEREKARTDEERRQFEAEQEQERLRFEWQQQQARLAEEARLRGEEREKGRFKFEQEQALWQRGQAGQAERWNFIMMLLTAWPRLSLAGRSAVRDLVTRMGFNFDDILARMGLSEEITQPGMARFAPAGQLTGQR